MIEMNKEPGHEFVMAYTSGCNPAAQLAPLIVCERVSKTDRLAEADRKLVRDRKRRRLGLRVTDRLSASLRAVISPTDGQIAVHSSSLSPQSAQEDAVLQQSGGFEYERSAQPYRHTGC